MSPLKRITHSKYIHLCAGLLAFYGLSTAVTYTSREEKIAGSLWYYCHYDYVMTETTYKDVRAKAFYLRERYRERFEDLTSGRFDYRDKGQMQAFFMRQGLLYEEWSVGRGFHSYLLAKVIGSGSYEAEIPEKVEFEYYILGEEKIPLLEKFLHGQGAGNLVSAGGKKIYIHKGELDSLLGWYFDCLWEREPRAPEKFHWSRLTKALYRDLKPICEDVLIKRLFPKKELAKKYFMGEASNILFPTLLLMGARLVADKDYKLTMDQRYERAFLAGLSLKPTFTMLELCHGNPRLRNISNHLPGSFDLEEEDQIALRRISQAAQRILDRMNRASQKP